MRRKLLRTFLAAAVISVLFTVSAYAETAIVTRNGVNFRSGPGTNYYVIATLNSGTPVQVLDRSGGSWVAVSCGGYNGYISSAYLSLTQTTQSTVPNYSYTVPPSYSVPSTSVTAPTVTAEGTGYINANYVRFRSGPGSSYSVLGTYNSGKPVTIIGSSNGWTTCMIDGRMGYVYSQYISVGGSSTGSSSGSSNGIVVVPGQSTGSGTTLPQPNEGIVVRPQATAAPVVVVTPVPTYAPIVVTTPAPNYYPTPTATPAPVTTPSAVVTPSVSVNNSANATGYIAGSYVRFRSGPGTNYSILGTFNTGKALIAHSRTANGWLLCTIDGVNGYVNENYVLITSNPGSGSGNSGGSTTTTPSYPSTGNTGSTGNSSIVVQPSVTVTPSPTPNTSSGTAAYIVGNNVRFRSAPSMNSQIISELFYGNAVTLHAVSNGWALVSYNGQTGYVYAQYVKQGSYGSYPGSTGSNGTGSSTNNNVGTTGGTAAMSGSGQDVANYALRFVGYNYCWGGASPDTGFDCSGFVYYIYKQFGYNLNRVAQDQAANGVHVDPSAIQPGDVLCFYSGSSYIGHSGIYIGNGKFVHASNSTTGVIISELSGYYSNRGFEARRIIN